MATEPVKPVTDPAELARLAAEYGGLHVTRKKCYLCGTVFQGYTFKEYPADVEPLPGICAPCAANEENELKRLQAQGPVTESGVPLGPLPKPIRPPDEAELPDTAEQRQADFERDGWPVDTDNDCAP